MQTVGNILWLIFVGLWLAIGFVVAGIFMFILIITIPFGIQAFKMAGFALWPFGRHVEYGARVTSPLHIIGNTVFLWIFGPTLENEIGHLKFAALYLAGGMCGWLAEIAAEPTSTVANLGASGAIAAVMGAYLITWRREGARRVSFFGWSFPIGLIPALVLIALFSAGLVTDQTEDVAYMAHAGGLVFGAVLGSQFRYRL